MSVHGAVRAAVGAATVAALVPVLVGCGVTQGAGAGSGGEPAVAFAEAFTEARGIERVNFDPFTPTRLASVSSIVVYGSVASVEDGRVHDLGGGILRKHVVIGIDPIDVVKDDPARDGELVHVELGRPDDDSSVEKIGDALPIGARVALFGWPADPGSAVQDDDDASREPGSSVYVPFPQGLWFETAEGLANVLTPGPATTGGAWEGVDTWAELKDAATP